MQKIITLAEKVLNGQDITKEEAEFLINVSDDDTMLLLAMADKIRQKYAGDAVDCCAIINGRSGKCSENCKFCAQSAHYHTGVKEYGLLSEEEIFNAAKKLRKQALYASPSLPAVADRAKPMTLKISAVH